MTRLLRALRQVATGSAKPHASWSTAVLAVVDYQQNFEKLWDLLSPASRSDWPRRIVLVDRGDVTRLGEIAYAKNLRALDWALIACSALSAGDEPPPLPEIYVLDLAPETESGVRSFVLLASLKRRGLSLPVFLFQSSNPAQIAQLVEAVGATPTAAAPLTKGERAVLADCWSSGLANADSRGSHHQLNNSIAPLAISAGNTELGCKVSESQPHSERLRLALWRSLTELASDGVPLTALPGAAAEFEIVLVDDQAKHGWETLLNWILFPSKERAVSVHECPEILLDALETRWRQASAGNASGRFSFALNDKGHPEVLFLDLRLFLAEEQREEHAFLQRLVGTKADEGLVQRMGLAVSNESARAGSGLAAEEVEDLRNWLASVDVHSVHWQESDLYLRALTVLPRLIASFDCSYPIILFSSTGQRTILESLSRYPSIHTGLKKPRFGPYASGEMGFNFVRQLQAAVGRCRKWLEAREAFRKLSPRTLQSPSCRGKYIEIFTDESGTDKSGHFVVTALAVVYSQARDAAAAAVCNTQLQAAQVDIDWLHDNGVVAPAPARFTWRHNAARDHVPKRWHHDGLTAADEDVAWSAFRSSTAKLLNFAAATAHVERIVGASVYTKDLPLLDFGPDAVFLAMTIDALEVLICDLLRDQGGWNLSIFVANRRRYVSPPGRVAFTEQAFRSKLAEYKQRYGIQLDFNRDAANRGVYEPYYQSVSKETAVRMWAELALRNPKLRTVVPQICRGEPMNTTGAERELHNLADMLASSWNSSHLAKGKGLADATDWLSLINRNSISLTYTQRGSALAHARKSRISHELGSDGAIACMVEGTLAAMEDALRPASATASAIPFLTQGATHLSRTTDAFTYAESVTQLTTHPEYAELQKFSALLRPLPIVSVADDELGELDGSTNSARAEAVASPVDATEKPSTDPTDLPSSVEAFEPAASSSLSDPREGLTPATWLDVSEKVGSDAANASLESSCVAQPADIGERSVTEEPTQITGGTDSLALADSLEPRRMDEDHWIARVLPDLRKGHHSYVALQIERCRYFADAGSKETADLLRAEQRAITVRLTRQTLGAAMLALWLEGGQTPAAPAPDQSYDQFGPDRAGGAV